MALSFPSIRRKMSRFSKVLKEYLQNASVHGVRFLVDEDFNVTERIFWLGCIILSWIASGMLIMSSLDAFRHNAISFVVETSYRDWNTRFPAIIICESKNTDRIQEFAEDFWGVDHDFTMEEILSEITYFRGESYHMIHECGQSSDYDDYDGEDKSQYCIRANFSMIAKLVRSSCEDTLSYCSWNDQEFECCKYFQPVQTELGICYAVNSVHVDNYDDVPKLDMISNKRTGPGSLFMEVLTEANIYTIGEEDVPNLVTPKSEILSVGPYIAYNRLISLKNIENDPLTRDVDVKQRNCRYSDENILNVHNYYSYSACSVQCRKDKQLQFCNCTSHLMPNTPIGTHCDIDGLKCLNDNYEELSVVIAPWSSGKKGVVCDCLPSCTEVDITVVHDVRGNIFGNSQAISKVRIGLATLPTERYKRNVIRGKLDLVVSMGGTTGLFVGASLLSFVEIFYYFCVRPYYSFKKQT